MFGRCYWVSRFEISIGNTYKAGILPSQRLTKSLSCECNFQQSFISSPPNNCYHCSCSAYIHLRAALAQYEQCFPAVLAGTLILLWFISRIVHFQLSSLYTRSLVKNCAKGFFLLKYYSCVLLRWLFFGWRPDRRVFVWLQPVLLDLYLRHIFSIASIQLIVDIVLCAVLFYLLPFLKVHVVMAWNFLLCLFCKTFVHGKWLLSWDIEWQGYQGFFNGSVK